MKLLKTTMAAAISGLLAGAGTAAYATVPVAPAYTFTFYGNTDNADFAFNGSTITIQNNGSVDTIIGWDLVDTAANSGAGVELTTANSTLNFASISSYSASTWVGAFEIDNTFPETSAVTLYDYTLNFFGDNDGTASAIAGDLNDSFFDPPGTWSPQASVPDSQNSFQLFAMALAALGACQFLVRRQAVVRVRN